MKLFKHVAILFLVLIYSLAQAQSTIITSVAPTSGSIIPSITIRTPGLNNIPVMNIVHIGITYHSQEKIKNLEHLRDNKLKPIRRAFSQYVILNSEIKPAITLILTANTTKNYSL